MKQRTPHEAVRPTKKELQKEIRRVEQKREFYAVLRNTVYTIVTVASLAALIAVFLLPVYQVHGTAMQPTISQGQFVMCVRDSELSRGDVVALYYGAKPVIRRVIAIAGDRVEVTEDGTVLVNDRALTEPYVSTPTLGNSDCEYPVTVGEGEVFLLGDARETAVDSRMTAFGNIRTEDIVGRAALIIWPLRDFGAI